MSLRRLAAATALALFVVPAIAIGGLAQEGDPVEQDRAWREERRELAFAADTTGFEAESTRTSELGDDEFITTFDLDTATLRMRYVSVEPGNETVISMTYTLLAVVEFRDRDADGAFGLGDRIVQRVPVAELSGTQVSEPFLAGGHRVTASYDLPRASGNNSTFPDVGSGSARILPGHVGLRFYVLPVTQRIDGVRVAPMDLKFDLIVDGYEYERDDSQLAIETRLTASRSIGPAAWHDDALDAEHGFFRGYLSWTPTVDVDGTTQEAAVTTLAYGDAPSDATDARSVAFAYPRGDRIVHDPQLGVIREQGAVSEVVAALIDGDWVVYGLAAVVATALVAVPAYRRLRD